MKICVLGGGGVFGMNTARYLLRRGYDVFGIGRSPMKPACFSLGIEREGYRYWAYHITHELDYVMEILDRERPGVIINYAAQGEGAVSFNPKDYWRFYETNAMGLARLAGELQRRDWLQRFIHIGTSELYGSVTAPSKESAPIKPSSPYAASKAAFDLHLLSVSKLGFPMNIIRPSNCYAPGQQLHRIIPKAIIYALSRRKLPLHGGGKAEKSYLHADDLSAAILAVMNKGEMGKVYNCGPLAPISIASVVEMCAKACGIELLDLCEITEDRPGQDSRYWLDSSELSKDTGWTQTIGIKNGIADMVQWVRQYPELLTMDTDYRMRS